MILIWMNLCGVGEKVQKIMLSGASTWKWCIWKKKKRYSDFTRACLVLKRSQHTEYMSCACLMAYSLRKVVFYLVHTPKIFYPLEGFKKTQQTKLEKKKILKLHRNCSFKRNFLIWKLASMLAFRYCDFMLCTVWVAIITTYVFTGTQPKIT